MTLFDEKSCRICLSPNTAFINVFGAFHKRSVDNLIFQVCQIKPNRNKRIPQCICELCISKLLSAESIKSLCKKNEKFLTDYAELRDYEQQKDLTEHSDTEINVETAQQTTGEIEFKLYIEPMGSISPNSNEDSIDWDPIMELNERSKLQADKTAASFFCTYCFKHFNTKAKFSYHEKTQHEPKNLGINAKQFTCDRCGIKFKQKSHVINHLNVVHLRIKRYQCNICGFAMYAKTHHTTHMKTHSNIREFKCEECGKEFSRKEALFVHQRTHTNERPYICKFCDRSYTAHTDLKRHLFTHTGIHPYMCQLCNKGFFLKRVLYEHVNNEHPGIDTTSWLSGKTLHNFKT